MLFAETLAERALQEIPPDPTPTAQVGYSDEIAEKVCKMVAGGASIIKIGDTEGMPCSRTISRWINTPGQHENFCLEYACALDLQAERALHEMEEIADDAGRDYVYNDKKEEWEFRGDNVQRARLRVDVRKYKAECRAPHKFGKNVQVEVKGEVKHTHEIVMGDELTGIMGRMGVNQEAIEGGCEAVEE